MMDTPCLALSLWVVVRKVVGLYTMRTFAHAGVGGAARRPLFGA